MDTATFVRNHPEPALAALRVIAAHEGLYLADIRGGRVVRGRSSGKIARLRAAIAVHLATEAAWGASAIARLLNVHHSTALYYLGRNLSPAAQPAFVRRAFSLMPPGCWCESPACGECNPPAPRPRCGDCGGPVSSREHGRCRACVDLRAACLRTCARCGGPKHRRARLCRGCDVERRVYGLCVDCGAAVSERAARCLSCHGTYRAAARRVAS